MFELFPSLRPGFQFPRLGRQQQQDALPEYGQPQQQQQQQQSEQQPSSQGQAGQGQPQNMSPMDVMVIKYRDII